MSHARIFLLAAALAAVLAPAAANARRIVAPNPQQVQHVVTLSAPAHVASFAEGRAAERPHQASGDPFFGGQMRYALTDGAANGAGG
jgi:hypothetical protein